MPALRVTRCTTEFAENPLGVDERHPRFGWVLESSRRNQAQSAYQVIVASSESLLREGIPDIWDSERVESTASSQVACAGLSLKPATRYFWSVRAWDADGVPSAWSKPAWFETGLLSTEEWGEAAWIGAPARPGGAPPGDPRPAPMLRRSFTLDRAPSRARVYVSGLGYCEMTINGRRVGDHVLDPGYTRFDKRALYSIYDVTGMLRKGENVVGVTLGRGWYGVQTPNVWRFHEAPWHGEPRLRLRLDATDGDTRTVICSDGDWKSHDGPTVADSIYIGDTYDARNEMAGWDEPGFDDASWSPVRILPITDAVLQARPLEPMRVVKTLKPMEQASPRPDTWVYDLGVNIAGWARIRVKGEAGTTYEIRYDEKRDKNGLVNLVNDLVSAPTQVDRYTLKGEGTETWEPRFSYKGFRYIQVSGPAGARAPESVEGREVHTDVRATGTFSCSDPVLNAIHRMTLQSLVNNYHSIPTDTPVYEKNGWMGDGNLTAEAGLRNFDTTRFYAKWLDDIADSQRADGLVPLIAPDNGWGLSNAPEWGAAYILVTAALYRHAGDLRVVERHYDRMRRYMTFLESQLKDGISPSVLGDWLPPGFNGNPPEGPAVSASAYVFRCARAMQSLADKLGRADDARHYEQLAGKIADAMNTRYLDRDAAAYHTEVEAGYRQASNILPLAFGITPAEMEARVLDRLIQDIREHGDHLNTGILGAAELLSLLTRHGHVDLALRVATRPTAPGWGYWVERGSPTLWEAWGDDARSLGHHMFGSIEDWFYQYLAGIHPAGEDRRILIRPYIPHEMSWAKASVETTYGTMASSWLKDGNGGLTLEVRVPVNTTARVEIPLKTGQVVSADPPDARRLPDAKGRAVFAVGSGETRFTAR